MGPSAVPDSADVRFAFLGAVIAGTLTAGLNAAGPSWLAVPLGITVAMLLGYLFPSVGTWGLVAGLLLAPLIATVTRSEPLLLILLTLPIATGLMFALVRVGQRWHAPGAASDPEARGRRIRLAIILTVAAAVIAPAAITDRRWSRDADSRAQAAGEQLRNALNRVELGNVSPFHFTEVLREQGAPPLRAAQIGAREVRVTAEVDAGWHQRCIRGVRQTGGSATIEILPHGCGKSG